MCRISLEDGSKLTVILFFFSAGPHANPRLPPYPHPAVQAPLAQLRQSPHPPLAPAGTLDVSLRVCATFASPRAWLLDSQTTHPRDGPRDSSKVLRRAVDSIFVMACHGNLVQYDLDPKPVISKFIYFVLVKLFLLSLS